MCGKALLIYTTPAKKYIINTERKCLLGLEKNNMNFNDFMNILMESEYSVMKISFAL